MKTLPRFFYERDPVRVAKDLLGKTLVRRLDHEILSGRIVETEAYIENDIASKTQARRKLFSQLAFVGSGRTFIYMVHGNWLLNIIAHPKGSIGGVLIRALEPIKGIETMLQNRNVKDIHDLTNGPGKLTEAFAITKDLNDTDVINRNSELVINEEKRENFEIGSSHRIGVKRDLPQELRFFIKGNKFVSKSS